MGQNLKLQHLVIVANDLPARSMKVSLCLLVVWSNMILVSFPF